MPLHPQAAAFVEALRGGVPAGVPDIGALRAVTRSAPPPDGGGVPTRVYGDGASTLVYFHGGGWNIGGLDSVDGICGYLAAEVGCTVVSVDYRLAPEHPFPAAVEDCYSVLRGIRGQVAVAGDSAGGNLAAVTAQLARDDGIALAHQLLICPNTDSTLAGESFDAYGEGYALDAGAMRLSFMNYARDADRRDPRLAPLYGDLAGLAPATVITAEYDILRDEGEAYARALPDAALRRYDGMIHNFVNFPGEFDAAIDARSWAAARLRTAFGGDA